MMETIIAIGVGVVVAGGILTLVFRILVGDRQQKKLDAELSRFLPPEQASAEGAKSGANKRKK